MSSSSEHVRSGRVIHAAGRTVALAPVPPAPPAPPSDAPSESFPARPSLDEMLEQARAEGCEEGRRAGAAAARDTAEATRSAAARRIAVQVGQAAQQVAALRSQVVDEVTRDVAGLVTDLAEVLVGRELVLGTTAAREAIVRALALAPRDVDLVVHVHPDCGLDDDEIAVAADGARVAVVRARDVDLHGCRLVAGGCHIDAQIPTALERVRSALDELLPSLIAGRSGEAAALVQG
ncbi:MAG: FliH/SctL family protein, partial [Acidimicrobiales bacterium]